MDNIKYLIMDVDGTLTDGKIYMSGEGELFKAFNIKDGYGITQILKNTDIIPVIITGRNSRIVDKRCKELGIKYVFQGTMEKLKVLMELVGEKKLGKCAYIGDDIPDLKCMIPVKKAGGIIGCPADAVPPIKDIADFICSKKAGDGAVREFIEWIVS